MIATVVGAVTSERGVTVRIRCFFCRRVHEYFLKGGRAEYMACKCGTPTGEWISPTEFVVRPE